MPVGVVDGDALGIAVGSNIGDLVGTGVRSALTLKLSMITVCDKVRSTTDTVSNEECPKPCE